MAIENNIKIDIKDSDGCTALHTACEYNEVECVQLFLTHNTCTKDIVRLKNKIGETAEMIADRKGYHECARLVREYLENNEDAASDRNEETKLENLTLTEVAKRIEDMNDNEALILSKMKDDCKKELEKLDTEYKRKRDETLEKHDVENKKFCSKNEKTKKALHKELEKKLGSYAAGTPGPSTPPPPSSPDSLLPSCPVCYDTMKPPLQIFTCGNGHLICSSCKPRATKCFWQAMYMGRATAMEQMVGTILNIQ